MMAWLTEALRVMFGTPQRAFRTIIVMIGISLVVSSGFREWLLCQLQSLAAALLPPLLILGIIVWAFRTMLGPLFPGGRRRH